MVEESEPSVEFVIPFYGSSRLLRETISSVQAQSDPRWRAIVVDDCYPDESAAAWVGGLDDPRITLVRNAENLGTTATYTKGLALTTSEYVTILGCDDRLLPTYLARMRAMARRAPAVIQPGVQIIDGDGLVCRPLADRVKDRLRPSGGPVECRGEPALRSLMLGNWTYFPSLCWRREVLSAIGFQPFPIVQDLAMLSDVLMSGGSILVDSPVTFEYRRHRTSYSNLGATTGTRFDEERDYLRSVAAELADRGWVRAARAARFRPTSRTHAALLIPRAAAHADLTSLARLARHVVAA